MCPASSSPSEVDIPSLYSGVQAPADGNPAGTGDSFIHFSDTSVNVLQVYLWYR